MEGHQGRRSPGWEVSRAGGRQGGRSLGWEIIRAWGHQGLLQTLRLKPQFARETRTTLFALSRFA